MSENVTIIKIEVNKILVVPIITDVCINCTQSSCSKRGKSFWVKNPLKLPIKVGNIVALAASNQTKSVQAVISLFFPLIMAVAGYFLAGAIYVSAMHTKQVPEIWRVSGVVVCFIFSTVIVFIKTHIFSSPENAHITEILRDPEYSAKCPEQNCSQ